MKNSFNALPSRQRNAINFSTILKNFYHKIKIYYIIENLI